MRNEKCVCVFLAILLVSVCYGMTNIGNQGEALGIEASTESVPVATKSLSDSVDQVTLVTGDIVIVSGLSEGQKGISITPANPTELGRSFQTFEAPEGTYVIPSDVNLDKLDMELFNVEYLTSEGYHKMANLPVIVDTAGLSGKITQSIESGIRDFKGRITASLPTISALAAQLPQDTIKDSIQTLLERADVEKIWLDRRVHVSLSESVPLIGAPELWDAGYNGTGIEIAILDTGIDDTHPDLDDFDDDPGTTDPKVIRAIDFTDDLTTEDLYGHGTHCAGIAAGTGAASGGINKGVAPGAFLWNVKVLNQYGWGQWSWVISGIEYAAYGPDGVENTGDEADIISMSLGGPPTNGTDPVSLAVDAAVDAGIVVVIAAGNERDYFKIDCPGVARKAITVGASDKYDSLASFSSKGPTIDFRVKPDVLAPGVSITSCVPYSLYGTYYQSKSGTSMATPHVAGAVALILQKGVPSDWTAPQYAKNTFISTAVDLGYDVYAQGGGRIYVPSAAYTQIFVDPATVSFGSYFEDTSDNATLTFYNLNATSNRILTLNVTVSDIFTGAQVDCASLNATTLNIAANSSASVLLSINTTVPKSIYSGRLAADIDTGETVHAIFGFAKLNEVIITKVDMTGAPAAYDYVYVLGEPGFPEWTYQLTNEYGNATFYVTDGTYHIVSIGMDYDTESTVYTIVENRSISSDTIVNLDERDTLPIDFDMNKPNQTLAEKNARLIYEGKHIGVCFFGTVWWYPTSALAYVSPTSFYTGFAYSYYPETYYNSSDPGTIDTPEWHKLLLTQSNITGSITFIADYDVLVQRTTDYKAAVVPDVAERVQFVEDPTVWCDVTFRWRMTVPQSRLEWLSPEPTYYVGWYSKWDPRFDWDFEESRYIRTYPPGAETYLALGEHPFTSDAEVYVGTGSLNVWGSISEDTFGNRFANWTRNVSGNLTIIQDGVQVYYTEIWDDFDERISFSDTPEFTVIIEGNCGLNLSTNTYTELKFIADTTQDYRPPRVTMRPLSSNLYCTVPPGEVLINVTVSDESSISSIALEYSLDDGTTWHLASSTQDGPNTWIADLETLSDCYVSLRVNATDSLGNKISQETIRGFYVAPTNLYLIVQGVDNHIYYRSWDGISWGSWTAPPGATIDSPAAAILNNNLHIVVRGTTGAIWHGYVNLTDSTFSGWSLLSGATPSAPTLAASATSLYLVVRGNDDRIYYRSWDGATWLGWTALPGATANRPAAAVLGGNLHIVVNGLDGNMYHGWVNLTTSTFSSWARLSGATPSAPELTASAGALYLVVRGMDNRIYYNCWGGPFGGWPFWTALPGATIESPAAAVLDNNLHMVVEGTTGHLWHGYTNLTTSVFSGWSLLTGSTPSAPELTA